MQDRSSRTAEHVALFRALESVRHGPRLFVDPYAVRFLPARYRLIIALTQLPTIGATLGHYVERYIDGRWPAGPRASAVVRTKLIDDLTTKAVAEGATQVLLLGAGYDSRAYRLPALASLPVFEVDHPATQQAKRRLIGDAREWEHVHFVPVDLLRDDLAGALLRAGLHTRQPTVVVWEGVTNYLSADAVDITLRYLRSSLASGSRIIFTYVDRGALEGSGTFAGYQEWHASVSRVGEQWTFGFHPDELASYLAERGMTLAVDISARLAGTRYLEPLGRSEPASAFYHIAMAEVR